jgi:hypothetical protein
VQDVEDVMDQAALHALGQIVPEVPIAQDRIVMKIKHPPQASLRPPHSLQRLHTKSHSRHGLQQSRQMQKLAL